VDERTGVGTALEAGDVGDAALHNIAEAAEDGKDAVQEDAVQEVVVVNILY
jgi:hypothetical protein